MLEGGGKLLEELAQESLFQNQQYGEVESPDEEVPARPVPDAGGRPHHQKVEKQPGLAHPVASQGDIEVLPEPGAEGDVPPPPELGDRRRLVGRVEVLREAESQQEGDADGHVRIA